MTRRQIGVLLVLVLCAVLLFGAIVSRATTRVLSWGAVTKYTDDTLIEASNTVTYSAWRQDNVTKATLQLANRIAPTSVSFDDVPLVKGRAYNFWVQAHLASGASSDNSAMYSWTVPLGKAATPAGLAVQ